MGYDKVAPEVSINRAIEALKKNGINAVMVADSDAAKVKVLEMIPKGAEVMTMTSVTLDQTGISKELNESGNYNPTRDKLYDEKVDKREKARLGAAPEYVIGSVHAVTEDGKVIVASNSGSQLPAYSYAAGHVIWVVGAQKLVTDFDDGLKRIYEYVLPLESERAKKAYGVPGSFVSKLLVFNKEPNPERITLIFVNEVLGY
jgi:hypothetical protein